MPALRCAGVARAVGAALRLPAAPSVFVLVAGAGARIMLLAKDPDGSTIEAAPKLQATCPVCESSVKPKCGSIKVWHWAHLKREDCDPWSEPESSWHAGWKNLFPRENREVVIGPHRADIKTNAGIVIELQHSSISAETITEREQFYGRMVWVIDAAPFIDRFYFNKDKGIYWTFGWERPRQTWLSAKRPIVFDLRDGYLFSIGKMHDTFKGWGRLLPYSAFVETHHGSKSAHYEMVVSAISHCDECGRNNGLSKYGCNHGSKIRERCRFCGMDRSFLCKWCSLEREERIASLEQTNAERAAQGLSYFLVEGLNYFPEHK